MKIYLARGSLALNYTRILGLIKNKKSTDLDEMFQSAPVFGYDW
jgi:hypothetical protein